MIRRFAAIQLTISAELIVATVRRRKCHRIIMIATGLVWHTALHRHCVPFTSLRHHRLGARETVAARAAAWHHFVCVALPTLHMTIPFDGVPLLLPIPIPITTEAIPAVCRAVIDVVVIAALRFPIGSLRNIVSEAFSVSQ